MTSLCVHFTDFISENTVVIGLIAMIIRELNRAKMVSGFMEKCTSIACNCEHVWVWAIFAKITFTLPAMTCNDHFRMEWTGQQYTHTYANGHFYLVLAWTFAYLPGIQRPKVSQEQHQQQHRMLPSEYVCSHFII